MNSMCKVTASLFIPLVALLSSGATVAKEPLRAEVLSETVNENGYQQLQIKVTNVSDADIAAYVLRMSLIDSEGRTVGVTERAVMEGLGGPKAKRALLSGDSEPVSWTVPVKDTWTKFSLSVDYVKFVSNSSLPLDWGPDISHMSAHIDGFLGGYRAERARLRQVLDQQGEAALIEDLRSDER